MPETRLPSITALIASGVLDPELAALLWLLAEAGVPLVAVTPAGEREAQAIRAAVADLRAGHRTADGLPAIAGGVVRGAALEDVLRFGAPPEQGSATDVADEARDLGVVLILSDAADPAATPRIIRAHYVRPIERDAAGHLQRRPPALLSAWNGDSERHDHFFWAITDELATRAGTAPEDFDDAFRLRVRLLEDLVAARVFEPSELARYIERAGLVQAGMNVASNADAPN